MELELKRFNNDASAKFSMHTIPSDRLSHKDVEQKEKMSKKRLCWIIMNLIVGSALIVNLLFSIENQHNKIEESQQEKRINRTWTLSVAVNEVK